MWSKSSFEKALETDKVKHSEIKRIVGVCSTAYAVCDILEPEMVTILGLKYTGEFRVLKPNEPQYKAYDNNSLWKKLQSEYKGNADYDDEEDDDTV